MNGLCGFLLLRPPSADGVSACCLKSVMYLRQGNAICKLIGELGEDLRSQLALWPILTPRILAEDVASLGIQGAAVCNVPFLPEADD